jgi:mono/diheme cytochrome c family protein
VRILRSFATVALILVALPSGHGQQAAVAPTRLFMSPALLELLRAEMRELLVASQAISVALPAGNWAHIAATSEKMRMSYILERRLTEAQRAELDSLPERFKRLDEQFHLRTEKLAHAAAEKDAELTAFYFARLLENCADCHAAYAQQRFPGFAEGSVGAGHQH